MYHETAVTVSVIWGKTNLSVLHICHNSTIWCIRTCSCCRRAEQLMAEDNDDAIPYCIATGDIKKLVTFFTGRGQLLEAVLIAQVQRQREGETQQLIRSHSSNITSLFFKGACEGNIRVPQSSTVNHTSNDVDNIQQYQRYTQTHTHTTVWYEAQNICKLMCVWFTCLVLVQSPASGVCRACWVVLPGRVLCPGSVLSSDCGQCPGTTLDLSMVTYPYFSLCYASC